MKYVLRVSALALILASMMAAQPKMKASVASQHAMNRMAFASGPTPNCDPSEPECGVPSLK